MSTNLRALVALAGLALAGCADEPAGPEALFDPALVQQDFAEVVPCKHSHEHELRHVRIFADSASAQVFERCVLSNDPACDDSGFAAGSVFVKYEYEYEGCNPDELVSYTAALKLEDGAFPQGRDWHWQRTTPSLEVVEDGAPGTCLRCHIDHCEPPYGYDLRCEPD